MSAVSQRWPEVARALQAHGFPPVQPQPPAAAAAAAAGGNSANQNSTIFSHDEATKLQATLLALLSQRSRHAVLVQELGDAAGRAEQQALVAQQRAAAVEDQLSSIRAMLTVEQDAVRRERRLREADQQQHRLAVAQLEAALRSAQEREAEAQRQVQVMQNHTQELREAAAAQAARETAHRQLLEQLFVELHGRQMDPHSSHDSRLLEMMDMYEARLQAAAQEIQRLQTQRLSAAGSQAPRTLGEAAMADVYAMANDDGQRIATAGTSAAHSSAAKEQFVALTQERDQLRSQLAAAETEVCAREKAR